MLLVSTDSRALANNQKARHQLLIYTKCQNAGERKLEASLC